MKLAALVVVAIAACDPPPPAAAAPATPTPAAPRAPVKRPAPRNPILVLGMGEDPKLTAQVEQVRAANHVAAIGLAVVRGPIVTLAVAGTLPGANKPLESSDRLTLRGWNDAVTASIAARLVDRGVLGWDAVDPKLGTNDLVTIVEHAGGKPWPELVHDEVFVPLGMADCVAAPSSISCSLADWARFAAAHAGSFAGNWLTPVSRDHVSQWVHGSGDTVLSLGKRSAVAVFAVGTAPGAATAAKQIVDAQLAPAN